PGLIKTSHLRLNWNPVASADDFSKRENPEYLVYALEQRLGVKASRWRRTSKPIWANCCGPTC
ncbi:hypothetical protein PMI35_04010, partial [Pseudomonas sp. GM78]